MLAARRACHDHLSASLAARNDDELAVLLHAAPAGAVGVGGGSSVLDVDGVPVFAKRIPITDRELAHPHSTANLYAVPIFNQYGIHRLAGPGFGAWRELAANLVITRGVLGGGAESFPLLYHWRVLPGRPPVADEHLDLEGVVAYFGSAPAVRRRLQELAGATASLVLFHEYVPHPLLDWLTDPVGQAETFERQLLDITAFLRSHELLHMDGHFGNMRASGDRIYLVDFGLATSPRFDLSATEREFVAHHVGHDADYAMMWLVNWLVSAVCRVPAPAGGSYVERDRYIRRCADGDIPLDVPAPAAGILARHACTAARMNDFCLRLYGGDIHAVYSAA